VIRQHTFVEKIGESANHVSLLSSEANSIKANEGMVNVRRRSIPRIAVDALPL
jgi:hypothetical protein